MKGQIRFYIPVFVVFLLGLLVSLFVFFLVDRQIHQERNQKFIQEAEIYTLAVESRLKIHIQSLHTIKAFYAASNFVNFDGFRVYVQSFISDMPDLIDVYYMPLVTRHRLQAHLDEVRKYKADYDVREAFVTGDLSFPILYAESRGNSDNLMGLNLLSSRDHGRAMVKAVETNKVIATPIIGSLYSDEDKLLQTVLFLTVESHMNVEEASQNGLVALSVSIDALQKNIEAEITSRTINAEISSVYHDHISDLEHEDDPQYISIVEIASQRLYINFSLNGGVAYHHTIIFYSLFATLLITILGTSYTYMLVRQAQKDARYTGEQERSRKLLLIEKARLQMIMDNVMEGIIVINDVGIVEDYNQGAEDIFGYTAEEVIGQDVNVLMPDPYRGQHDGYLHDHHVTGNAKIIGIRREVSGLCKDGTEFPMQLGVTKMNLEGRTLFIGLVNDMTEQKERQDELQVERDRANEANSAKSEFLANMSHEIRTPMNGVIGTASLLHDTKLDAKQREYVETIIRSGDLLVHIINDVLDLSKIEARKMILSSESFNLEATLRSVFELFKPKADEKNIEYKYSFSKDIPAYVVSDSGRICQALSNLINNAIKFTDIGEVHVSIGLESIVQNVAIVRFSVTDTGIGIPLHLQNAVFEQFSQAHDMVQWESAGTGLGLAITKALIEALDGDIGFNSIEGKGTGFWFHLPLHISTEESCDVDRDKYAENTYVDYNAKILVVEDVATNRMVIGDMLENYGCCVDMTVNGLEAVNLIKQGHEYDLVLMDLRMPVMDGLQATQAIRAFEEENNTGHVPILALTAYAMDHHQQECADAGMDDFLPKPIKRADLGVILEKWLDMSRAVKSNITDIQ